MWATARTLPSVLPTIAKCARTNLHKLTIKPCRTTTGRYFHTTYSCFDRRYSDKHEWVEVRGKTATVGISQYAQEALGDVVYAQLPDIGSKIVKNEECGALESVKAASEIYSPVSGTVVEKNTAVEDTPALVNQSCYEKGWLFKVEVTDQGELNDLMTDDQYKEFLKTNQH